MASTPVILLEGFLGSGKTTLLNHALNHRKFAHTAVVVNEFGEVGIDHLVVADLSENIVELRDGCLCCTIRGDLALTLRDLHRKRILEEIPAFERVVVETTGVANPIPLIHTLMANPSLQRAFHLDAVVCMVDGEHGMLTLAEHDTAANQVAMADVLLVSKGDCIGPAALKELLSVLKGLNPGAELFEVRHGDIDPARIFDRALFQPDGRADGIRRWLAATHDHHGHHDHGTEYGSHVIRREGPLSLAGTSVFLNRVVNELSENVLRIKGLASFREKDGRPALIHAVQKKFYPVEWLDEWPDEDRSSRLVFIGRNMDSGRIDELFESLCV